MIVTFIYKHKNSNTKYYGKYIGQISTSYEEGLDRQIAYFIFNILKEPLNLSETEDLIVGILGFNRDTTDYFSEEESHIFELLYCNWSPTNSEIYLYGKLIKNI